MMQRRILLTGSNGLMGQKVINLVAGRAGLQLLATGRGVNRHPLRQGYTYVSVDITDPKAFGEVFREFQPTDVIHTAAVTLVDYCEDHREECDAVNVEAVKYLCALCKEQNTRLVHISTDFVFDGKSGPYKENDPTGPVNYYGLSKLKAEQAVMESGIHASILRTILVYGFTPSLSRTNIVLWVKDSLEEKKNIKVVKDQLRCPTLAEDLAQASVSAVMRNAKGIYHISGAEQMTILELAQRTARFWKLDEALIEPVDSTMFRQPAMRPPVTGFVILKAQTELEFRPHAFEQGLALIDRQMRGEAN
ncbi:MAG: SDR family oxidoreductase [Bacteroidetes bacterium]|nr:MAG: SDR family oxidoreductase [Bacteroidota bacterium]